MCVCVKNNKTKSFSYVNVSCDFYTNQLSLFPAVSSPRWRARWGSNLCHYPQWYQHPSHICADGVIWHGPSVHYVTIVIQSCASLTDTLTPNPSNLICFSLFTQTVLSETCPAGMDLRPFLHCDMPDMKQRFINPGDFQPDRNSQAVWQMRRRPKLDTVSALLCTMKIKMDRCGFFRSDKSLHISSFCSYQLSLPRRFPSC